MLEAMPTILILVRFILILEEILPAVPTSMNENGVCRFSPI